MKAASSNGLASSFVTKAISRPGWPSVLPADWRRQLTKTVGETHLTPGRLIISQRTDDVETQSETEATWDADESQELLDELLMLLTRRWLLICRGHIQHEPSTFDDVSTLCVGALVCVSQGVGG